ncbi:hypothetical protein [Saliphagus sp. LR7]|uniref:hypothetical protein n=1 Tax=Saliphagus sp. LR7 TaxID=2282654 RepID=UPI000DF817B0|nr:hypothetical protein [Saliphagus sp. LR7]
MAAYALFERLRRPEHTGVHRCWPCTVANLLVLAIACLALGRIRKSFAAALGIVGAGAIWLRGYLVPYTPRFAPRLASLLPGDPFHEDPIEPGSGSGPPATGPEDGRNASGDEPAGDGDRTGESEPARGSLSAPGDAATGEDLLEGLLEAGVLEADAESVAPTDAFRQRWDEEIEALRGVDDDRLAEAALAESAAADADVVTRDDRTYVTLAAESGRTIDESWLRRPTAIGQTAAARALAEMGVPDVDRPNAAVALGMFLAECPDCGSELVERPVGGCCGPPQTGADGRAKTGLTCPDCRVHLHVFE